MNKFWEWFKVSPIASFLRVMLALVIGMMWADFAKAGRFDFTNWITWIIVAGSSSLPPILRWINPFDTAYGIGSKKK